MLTRSYSPAIVGVKDRSISVLVESSGLILDRDIATSGALVLATNEVGDLLVLCLLDGTLVVLWTLAEEFLLDEVDA